MIDMNKIWGKDELPLQDLSSFPADGGFTGIFRRIGCIGDSLASGEFQAVNEFGAPTYHEMYEYSWGQYLARMAGTTAVNMSRGGMTAKEYYDSFAELKDYWTAAASCDAIVIGLGLNDATAILAGEYELGDISDFDPFSPKKTKKTYVGYMCNIINKIKNQNPFVNVFIITPPRADRAQSKETLFDEMQRQILNIAEKFSRTYVLDFRTYAPVIDAEYKERFYMDGHLTPAGYLFSAKMICSYMDFIVRHEYDKFKQVGFTHSPIFNKGYFK